MCEKQWSKRSINYTPADIVLRHTNRDLTGVRVGKLTVVKPVGHTKTSQLAWECLCDCGLSCVRASELLAVGKVRSCGCMKSECCATRNRTHGLSGTPEHGVWQGMLARCYNQNSAQYADYGGRGIVVCEEWRASFAAFFRDMGKRPTKRHTIERSDNDKGYCPENCYWATRKEQNRNKRNNHWLTHNGRKLTLSDWSSETGVSVVTIINRLSRKWSVKKTLTRPVRKLRRT